MSVKLRDLSRRQWLAATASATFLACGPAKGTGFFGYGLVANAGDNSLSAIDLTRFRLSATIGLDASPSQVVEGAGRAYVLTPANGTVHVVNNSLALGRTRRLADHLDQIGFSRDGRHLLALAGHSNQLIAADLETLATVSRHRLSVRADSMDFSSTGYVAVASSSGAVELLELSSGQRNQTQTPPLGAIRFRDDGKILLCANLQNRSLLALDIPSLRVVTELPLAMRPDHLCFNHDKGQLFVSGAGMDGVAVVFPYQIMEVDQTLLAGRDPGTMTCSETPAFLFVGSSTGSSVCILSIDTRKVVGFVETGGRPSLLAVTPDSQYALVLDRASGDLGVIHVQAIRSNKWKSGAALFTMLSVGTDPVDLAILPREA